MSQSIRQKSPKREQSNKYDFKTGARRLECDEDKERFERKLAKIAKAKHTEGKGDGHLWKA